MIKTAVIHGVYRYQLTRIWDAEGDRAVFVMLNPSTADAREDDPTIRRCVGFSRSWGLGGIVVVNLFGLRATDPTELLTAADPVGPENENWVRQTLRYEAGQVVCAWGAHPAVGERGKAFEVLAAQCERELWCLGKTAAGAPEHPLYLPTETGLWQYATFHAQAPHEEFELGGEAGGA